MPTIRCLHEWVESSYFDLLQEFLLPQTDEMMSLRGEQVPTQYGRAVLTARAAVRHDPKYMLPDGDLAAFDRDGASGRTE